MSCHRCLSYLGAMWVALCIELVAFSLAAFPLKAQSQLVSVTFPPTERRGAPARTAGAGQRSIQCTTGSAPLTVLAPNNNIGTTVSANPSLFWYVPETSVKSAEFRIFDDRHAEVNQTTLTLSGSPGVVKLSLPATVSLKAGKKYVWYFGLICDPLDRGADVYVRGKIERSELSSEQRTKLAGATEPIEKAQLYAQAQIWQETLTLLAQLRREHPHDSKVTDAWTELLRSVQLDAIATEPIVEDLTPQPLPFKGRGRIQSLSPYRREVFQIP